MLKTAFVGCGGISRRYLCVYRDIEWVDVAACIDIDPEVAARAAAESGGRAAAGSDFAAALSPGIDVVVINTPNHLHREQAVAALAAGKHVLLQKPVAESIESAEAIERAAASATGRCGLYMSYFDNPLYHDLRDMARGGFFGDLVHMYARLMHRGGMDWSNMALGGRPTWRGSLEETGGGCLIQLAVHYVHLFEWISGEAVERVTAVSRNLHCRGLEGEDFATAILEFSGGMRATIDVAWCASSEEFSVNGTRGSVEYADNRQLSLASSAGPFSGRVVRYDVADLVGSTAHMLPRIYMEAPPPAMGDHTNPLNQHRLFLEAVRDGREPFVTIRSGLHDMRVVHAAYESSRTGRSVAL